MNAFKSHVQNHLELRFVYPNSECNHGRAVLDVDALGIPVWPIQGQKIQRRCVGQSSLSDLRQVVVQPVLVVDTTEVPLNRSAASTASFLAASLPTNLTQHMSMQLTRNNHGNEDECPAATTGTLRASRRTLRIPSPRSSLANDSTNSTNSTSTGTLVTSGIGSQILQYRPHLGESSCFSPVFCAIKDEFVAYYIIEHVPMTLERLMLYDPSALYGNVANTQALTSAGGNANDANRNHYSPIMARTGGGGSTYFNVPPHSPHSPRSPHNQSIPQSQSPRGGIQSGSPEKKKSSFNSRFTQHGEALKVVPSSPLLTTTSNNPVLHRRGGNSVNDSQTTANGGSGAKNNIMPGACFGLLRKMDPCMVVGSNVWTGASLGDLVRVQFLMYQLLSALDVLHGQHLTHGRLRPSNIHVIDLLWLKLFPSKQMLSAGRVTSSSSSSSSFSSYNQHQCFPWPSPVVFNVPRHLGHGNIETVTARWCQGDICNLNYLMLLNKAAGRTMGDALFCPVLPWVTDFTTAAEDSNRAGTGSTAGGSSNEGMAQQWCLRDLTKSKFRLNKGDTQLNVTYRSALEHGMMHGVVPHHIPGKYCCCI